MCYYVLEKKYWIRQNVFYVGCCVVNVLVHGIMEWVMLIILSVSHFCIAICVFQWSSWALSLSLSLNFSNNMHLSSVKSSTLNLAILSWLSPFGRGTVVLIVSCRCTYCCPETTHGKITRPRHYLRVCGRPVSRRRRKMVTRRISAENWIRPGDRRHKKRLRS